MAKEVRVYKPKDPETGDTMYSESLTDIVFDKDGNKLSSILSGHERSIGNKVEKEVGKSLIEETEIHRLAKVAEIVPFNEYISEVKEINETTTKENGVLVYYQPRNIFIWRVNLLVGNGGAVYFLKKEGNKYSGNAPVLGGIYTCDDRSYVATENKLLMLHYANTGGTSDDVGITQNAATQLYNANKSLIESSKKKLEEQIRTSQQNTDSKIDDVNKNLQIHSEDIQKLTKSHQVLSEAEYEGIPVKEPEKIYMILEE